MAQEPGNLSDFRTLALEQWDGLIASFFGEDRSEQLFDRSDDRTPEVVPVEWGSYPVRMRDCLQSMPGPYRLLDWSTPQGDIGRAELQEGYFEWRVVRDTDQEDPAGRDDDGASGVPGGARRSLSGRGIAAVRTVGGGTLGFPRSGVRKCDSFLPGVTPEERKAGFRDVMLPNKGNAKASEEHPRAKMLAGRCQLRRAAGSSTGRTRAARTHVGDRRRLLCRSVKELTVPGAESF